MLTNNAKEGNWDTYLDHIGLFFFFCGCAGVSIIVWVFNWVCWLNQCCCCDFLHNPVNKRIAWWMSFTFLLGMLACCISAFVTVNRFGFALEGSWCAIDRIYFDITKGQLKVTQPRWEGFSNITGILTTFSKIFTTLKGQGNDFYTKLIPTTGKDQEKWEPVKGTFKDYQLEGYTTTDFLTKIEKETEEDAKEIIKFVLPYTTRYAKIISSLYKLQKISGAGSTKMDDIKKYFQESILSKMKTDLIDDKFDYYARTLRACLKVLSMIYYCLLLIAVICAGVSMMFFACLKRQGYLITFMHVLWNVIRFFIISFFLYGTAYGIGFLVIRDSVAYMMYVFGENLKETTPLLLPDGDGKEFLNICLRETDNNFKTKIDIEDDYEYTTPLNDFFTNYKEISKLFDKISENDDSYKSVMIKEMKNNLKKVYTDELCSATGTDTSTKATQSECENLSSRAVQEGGLFGTFDCGFLKSDLAQLYRALYDASVESRILAALSLCSSFFGAVAVYFFLLVMHHYNNELFFDSGKSIFTGFDGFGAGYKNKNMNKDPAYKKRKLRAEIELTSRNDENSEYKGINKKEDDE